MVAAVLFKVAASAETSTHDGSDALPISRDAPGGPRGAPGGPRGAPGGPPGGPRGAPRGPPGPQGSPPGGFRGNSGRDWGGLILTEKGGVALHFFASDRSRRYDIDALPFLVCSCFSPISSNRSGVKHGVRWDGWVAFPKRVPSPRGMGGLVQLDRELE